MLTDFDPEYLGIIDAKADAEKEGKNNA